MYGNGLVLFGVVWGGLGYFKAVGFQKRNLAHYMYGDGLVVFWVFWGVLGRFGVFRGRRFPKRNLAHYMYGDWDGYGCFNGLHDGYANRSNSKTSFAYRFTDSSASRCRLTHDIWYPARCSAAHKN